MQMERFAQALREIGDTTREVSRKTGQYAPVQCGRCVAADHGYLSVGNVPGGYRCWQSGFDQTNERREQLHADALRRDGQLESGRIPETSAKCLPVTG